MKKTLLFLLFIFLLSVPCFATTLTYTTAGSTTWTAPANVSSIVIETWGAGGAGGSINDGGAEGGGGGGGAYEKKTYTVSPGTVYTIIVGAGGISSAAFNSNGGNSTFETSTPTVICQAVGGATVAYAAGGNKTGGAGGLSSAGTGDLGHSGGSGFTVISGSLGGGGGAGAGSTASGGTAVGQTGATGASGGGSGGAGGNFGGGSNGFQPGGGGGGAGTGAGGAFSGGTGGVGEVKLTYTALPGKQIGAAHIGGGQI